MSEVERRMIRLLGDVFVKAWDKSITAARIAPELRELRGLLDKLAQQDAAEALDGQLPSFYCANCHRGIEHAIHIFKNEGWCYLCFQCLKENRDAQHRNEDFHKSVKQLAL